MRGVILSRNEKAVLGLSVLAAVIGLAVCAPGFRPKHLRDIAAGLANARGMGILVSAVLATALLPAAARLKHLSWSSSVFGGVVQILGALFSIEILLAVFNPPAAAVEWLLRLLFIGIAAWGNHNRKARDETIVLLRRPWDLFSRIPNRTLQAFFFVVLFFFLRQTLHLLSMRAMPFVPVEDEGAWWHPLALKTMTGGVALTARSLNYTPGVGWLIALASRISGWHEPEWVMAFPFMVFAGVWLLITEHVKGWYQYVVGIFIWFFVCLASRDLHHLFVGMIYAEALCSLMVAGLLAELVAFLEDRRKPHFIRRAAGLGIYIGLCAVLKPPLSVLSLLTVPVLSLWLIKLREKSAAIAAFALPAAFSYLCWRVIIAGVGLKSEHTISFELMRKNGIDLTVPIQIITGLFNRGSPQIAYSTGLVLSFAAAFVLRKKSYLKIFALTILIYWGFVLGLYATLWQSVESYSAGRYISHAAMGLIYSLPLSL